MEKNEKALQRLLLEAPPDLKAAVDSTLDVRRAISAFRNRAMRVRDTGDLFAYVEGWYVHKYLPHSFALRQYVKPLVARNPYAAYKSKHLVARRFEEQLDFLLREVPLEEEPKLWTPQYRLGPKEVEQLLMDLGEPDGKLAKLITVNPYVTHEENLHMAVVDARLWLCESELPVELLPGSPSYKAIRWDGAPAKRQLLDQPPSMYDVYRRHMAAFKYLAKLTEPDLEIYHLSPADFEDQECYMARIARVGFAHLCVAKRDKREVAAELAACSSQEDEADSKATFLSARKAGETRFVYTTLARHMFPEVPSD